MPKDAKLYIEQKLKEMENDENERKNSSKCEILTLFD